MSSHLSNTVAVAMTRLLEADREVLRELIDKRLPVAAAVMAVPYPFVVGGPPDGPTLGALGLINGVLLMAGANRIAAHYDESGALEGFWPCDADGNPVPRQDGGS